MVDIPGDSSTTTVVSVGSAVDGAIEVGGDHDWFQISLTAGQAIQVSLNGLGAAALEDPYLRIRDSSGTVIFENDDGGPGRNALVAFSANYTGIYYIDVAAWDNVPAEYHYIGDYRLQITPYQAPPIASMAQIANQLTHGFWDGQSQHFAVTQGGSLSVNLTALTSFGQSLAREALRQWSDVIGVSFREVASGGQITFDDNEESAFSSAVTSGNIITSAHVNVAANWLNLHGTSINSYSFQTYLHEIGHALGLGHAGNYDGEARFPYDALFLNDAWSTTVMSYFSPVENSHFSALGFTENYLGTPMLADFMAMSVLYGLSTNTRSGDTVYGFNSTAGNVVYNASVYPALAYTVFDSGGIDTLDYSGFSIGQTIDLTSGAFSNVGGYKGNVAIAIGTVIENAKGGSGDDVVIGNAADNVLDGGEGMDTVSYATAAAAVVVDLGRTGAQNSGGAGVDTLVAFEKLIGSDFDDRLVGGAGRTFVHGGKGNDTLTPSADGDVLLGEDGDDVFLNGSGNDEFAGGDGFDTVDYSASASVVRSGTTGVDSLSGIERIIGSRFDDDLPQAAVVIGGEGNDLYVVYASTNQVIETAGQGVDTVRSYADFILPDHVENLSLHHDPGAGVAVFPGPGPELKGTGNSGDNVVTGSGAANQLHGMAGSDTLIGGHGADSLSGGAGSDTFRDTLEGLNGDTITDFARGERIIFTNASLSSFSFSLSASTLTYSGGSLTLAGVTGTLVAAAAVGGGVQLTLAGAANDASNDFNGDGRSDILWRHSDGRMTDWLGAANGGFFDNAANASTFVPVQWRVAGTGDFNGDGRDDILWRHSDGRMTDWLGASNGGFVDNAANASTFVPTAWQVAATGDFNGDGRDDILWRHSDGRMTDWLGASNGGFIDNAANASTFVPTTWQVAATGDFNGDGRDDILWRHADGRMTNWLGASNGGFFDNVANASTFVPTQWQVAGAGDFNGDGRDDILWRHDDGRMTNWLGLANGGYADNAGNASTYVPIQWQAASIGDFNGDGRDDILWRHGDGRMTDWLGLANGGFADNAANAATFVPTDWTVQPQDYFA